MAWPVAAEQLTNQEKAYLINLAMANMQKSGWCRGWMRNAFGEMCSIGALYRAVAETAHRRTISWLASTLFAQDYVHQVAEEIMPGGQLMKWNDEPGRTKEEVIAKFREAVDRLGEGVHNNGGLVAVSGQEAAQGT